MMATVIAFSRYFIALLFGASAAASLAQMPRNQKNYLAVVIFCIPVFIVQVICLHFLGMETTLKIYPLLTHLPIALFVFFYVKQSWLISLTSMFVSFLCCQPARWIGSVLSAIFSNVSMNHIGYNVTVILTYYLLQKYISKSVWHLMERSFKSCLLLGSMPALYYVFDYITSFYTDFIYSGTRTAVQFMPFITSSFYLIFVLLYYNEIQNQTQMQRERDMIYTQFKQAQKEFASLKQMQQNAKTYRHDMRHHFALLQSLAAQGKLEEIKTYLQTAESDIDTITPHRYCENDTVNLILSAFASKAKEAQIHLEITANLSESLALSDTELCSLLSNALENAIKACEKIKDVHQRHIRLRVFCKNNKLCLDIRNTFESKPVLHDGLPVVTESGHGFGTKSMAHIVEKHGGVYQFTTQKNWFIFQATM